MDRAGNMHVMSVRVFVANDHGILRGALRAVINMQSDMEVVGEAATGPDAEIGINETEPDVVLMDISMPNGGGLDAIAAVKRLRSRTQTVVLTFQEELGYVRAAGAVGYVAKRAMNTELLSAIRAAAQGRNLADTSTRSSPTGPAHGQGAGGVSGRELQMQRSGVPMGLPLRGLIDPG
jgi:DNA-binding NarL/FixJ family response regulator